MSNRQAGPISVSHLDMCAVKIPQLADGEYDKILGINLQSNDKPGPLLQGIVNPRNKERIYF
jgi:hypothetical protein